MSNGRKGSDRGRMPAPTGQITEVAPTKTSLDVTFRLKNEADRALHYIAEVRTIRFDPATKRLVAGLSDAGRVLIPMMVNRIPDIKAIDAGSEAELKLALPTHIRMLAPAPAADGSAAFESHDLTTATEVVVEVAWSDVPYYPDPRPSDGERMPTEHWAKGIAVMATRPKPKRGKSKPTSRK